MIGENSNPRGMNIFWYKVNIKAKEYWKALTEYDSGNNRVRATSPALWVTGDGAPDFKPSQWVHSAEGHESYLDPAITFNNLYED